MNKEKVINILKSFEYFIDDDWGGYYTNIDCSQRATTPLGILKILDYIDDLNNETTNLKNAINEIQEYIYKNSIPIDLLSNPPKHRLDFEGDINDILQIIDNLGDEK